jgi:carboxyl-terminal processing protease
MRSAFTATAILFLITASFGGGLIAANARPVSASAALARTTPSDLEAQFKVFWESWDIVHRDFVDKKGIDDTKLAQGAIKGMLEALGDPHTTYVEPTAAKLEDESLSGKFDGIGATVSVENKMLVIVSPIEDSPAQKAGLEAGDVILKIEGVDATKYTLQEAVQKIRGPRGTLVKLDVLKNSSGENVHLEITRGEILTPSVILKMLDNDVAHIRITSFSERTDQEFDQKLQEAKQKGAKALVLDLRNNPGGYLKQTVDIASEFLKDGVVLYQVDGDGKRDTWTVQGGWSKWTDQPMVVLVNKGSASGSEVLAGALQDRNRAKLIGEETFGKGTVNTIRKLSDGGDLFVSIARWLTPNNRQIEGKGVAPDIEVKMTDEDFRAKGDIQLNRALELLKNGN